VTGVAAIAVVELLKVGMGISGSGSANTNVAEKSSTKVSSVFIPVSFQQASIVWGRRNNQCFFSPAMLA
jgi:hypothetical protein